jgi:carboxypeptidase Taq
MGFMTKTREDALERLKKRYATIADIGAANSVLFWDQQTYMPKGAIAGRAEQMATLSRLAHEMLVDSETGRLLDAAGDPDPETVEGALIRRARRDHEKATRLPSRLVEELSRATALAEPAWAEARAGSDWSRFAPHLEKIMPLQREVADSLGYEDHVYDALLDGYEPGATKARLEVMFDELKAGIVPMIRAISENGGDRAALLHGEFDETAQERFGEEVATSFGYDWEHGRQDRVVHPFCLNLGPGDVRITTRFDPDWLSPALFGTMHETGHALYEQGVDPSYARTPLANGTSMGVHESQSRLWENLAGHSRPFWSCFYPRLRSAFPEALGGVEFEEFYRAINAVSPSMIRVEADEVTYNLHIVLRFELEVALLERSLSVADLPDAWNAKMEEYLGLTPQNDAEGALQDVHWAAGLFGYFPTYAIGNVLSVQLFDEAVKNQPGIPDAMLSGGFSTLLGWLRENVHRHGSRYYPDELIQRVTGRPLESGPYLRYLNDKYGELYDLTR